MKKSIKMILVAVSVFAVCLMIFTSCAGEAAEIKKIVFNDNSNAEIIYADGTKQEVELEGTANKPYIVSIEKSAVNEENGETEYTFVFSDGTTYSFSVKDGVDGTDGTDGADGTDGKDGQSHSISVNSNGYWVIDGNVIPVYAGEQLKIDGTLSVEQSSLVMPLGSTYALDLSAKNCGKVTWISDDTSVVTVTENGIINAVGAGKATVSAKGQNGKTDSCTVEVSLLKFEPSSLGGYSVTGYYGSDKNIIIPAEVCGIPVVEIGESAFEEDDPDAYPIESVVLPDSIIRIGKNAFRNCASLKSVTLSKNLKHIGEGAFWWCVSLENITIPNGVETIGRFAFNACKSFTEVDIPDSVNSIGIYGFAMCENLERITFGAGVKSIGDWAFFETGKLTDIRYVGSAADWNNIDFGGGEDNLSDATVTVNYQRNTTK